jgi:gluconolactonase
MRPQFLILFTLPLLRLAAGPAHSFDPHFERLDPTFDQLVAPTAQFEKLAEGFSWSEGPVWLDGALLFSDVPQNITYRWKPGMTSAEIFLKPSGMMEPRSGIRECGSNGLTRDVQGRLILCQQGERRIARYDGTCYTVLVDRYEGKRFNSPNDIVQRKNGDFYFTDPPYGLKGEDESPVKELSFNGVYRLTPDGRISAVLKNLTRPNGLGFSPDEKIFYVTVSDPKATRVMAYDVQADGTLANERVFYDAQPLKDAGAPGLCDGMKVDREGNVWSAGPGGILVISPKGKLLGRLSTGEPTSNCNWGGDGSTLYITANMFLVRVQTQTKGAGWK